MAKRPFFPAVLYAILDAEQTVIADGDHRFVDDGERIGVYELVDIRTKRVKHDLASAPVSLVRAHVNRNLRDARRKKAGRRG